MNKSKIKTVLIGGLSMFIPGAAAAQITSIEPLRFPPLKKRSAELVSHTVIDHLMAACAYVGKAAQEQEKHPRKRETRKEV